MAYDFPNAPSIGQVANGYVWDGEKWKASNSTGPVLATKKNYIINGAMQVSQENGTTAKADNNYPVDMFHVYTAVASILLTGQVASLTPGGSPNKLSASCSAAHALVASDFTAIYHEVEGLRAADLGSGTAGAKTITVQFGVYTNVAGTYSLTIQNGAGNRTYVTEYTIAAGEVSTNVIKSVTIQLDTTGTWVTDNTKSIVVMWVLAGGSSFQQAAGSWQAGNKPASTNQVNFFATINNIFQLFDVSLTEGSVAPPFQVLDYASELALCQRYWRKTSDLSGIAFTATQLRMYTRHVPVMRASPTGLTPGSTAITITDVYANNPVQSSLSMGPNFVNTDVSIWDFANFTGLTVGRLYYLSPNTPMTLNARL